MATTRPPYTVRLAVEADLLTLARHRVAMFRDMGQLADGRELERATAACLEELMPRGLYLAWLAEDHAARHTVVGGAGVQLRAILPRPRTTAPPVELGPEAIVLNVYVEPVWRRRGVAGRSCVSCLPS